jgi:UDP-glucuronate 4-epimerase
MAIFMFTRAILAGEPIDVFNNGDMRRDFTYIDDIVEGVVRVSDIIPARNHEWNGDTPDPSTSRAPYRIYNIGNNTPVPLLEMIDALEKCLGRRVERRLLPMQPGDVPETYADVQALTDVTGFTPSTPIAVGIERFVDWYRDFYRIPVETPDRRGLRERVM